MQRPKDLKQNNFNSKLFYKMKSMWKYFKCQQCGSCCSQIGLPYDPFSFQKLAAYLELPGEQVINKFYGEMTSDGKKWTPDSKKRTPCPFLQASESKYVCTIYTVRPEGCKLYPIDTDGGRDGVDCPGWKIAIERLRKEQEDEYY